MHLAASASIIAAVLQVPDPPFWPRPSKYEPSERKQCSLDKSFAFNVSEDNKSSAHLTRLVSSMKRSNNKLSSLFGFGKGQGDSCGVITCDIFVEDPNGGISDDTVTEAYNIDFQEKRGCYISCKTVYGCMHGMKTFLQLVDPMKGYRVSSSFRIEDRPGFSYRGLLLDTGRHFLPLSSIMKTIEMLSETKMNVFHWHISDDQSFPLKLDCCPLLSEKGAYSVHATYSKKDVREIVEYAASLGVRVIPEIDVPGHTKSWLKGYPELLGIAKSAIDPTREENYVFMRNLLKEVSELFKSDVYEGKLRIHLGGDETWGGWDTDEIGDWMSKHEMENKADLIRYWVKQLVQIGSELGTQIILWNDFLEETGWEDSSDSGDFGDAENHIIWQSWKYDYEKSVALSKAISRPVILSKEFYLDQLGDNWVKFYSVAMNENDPLMGGVACMWGENVDGTNLMPRVWPRTAAIAERLWCGSRCETDASISAAKRLSKWRCRMLYFFGFTDIEPVGQVKVNTPDNKWPYQTDKEEWYCAEADLGLVNTGQPAVILAQ